MKKIVYTYSLFQHKPFWEKCGEYGH